MTKRGRWIAALCVIGALVLYALLTIPPDQARVTVYYPTRTLRPIRTRYPTRTATVTRTTRPTNTPTDTPTPQPTPTPIVGYVLPISLNPLAGVTDKASVSLQLRLDDITLAWWNNPQVLDQFPNQTINQGYLLNVDSDGYPDNIPGAISSFLATCDQYGIDRIYYNLEWQVSFDKQFDRITKVLAELKAQGNQRPVIWVPTFAIYQYNFARALSLFDGVGVQLQKYPIGQEGALTVDAVERAYSQLDNPYIEVQIACSPYYGGRSVNQVITAAYDVEAVQGVSALSLLYGQDWVFCAQVLEALR